jgi:hypothetical protein
MFGIGKGKLFREGAQIQGVVTERNGPRHTTDGGRANPYHVTVRVKFDDGSTAEIKRKLDRREVGIQSPGAILPLRYDPADRSNIEIEVSAIQGPLEAKAVANKARIELIKEEAIARAEQQISGGDGFPDA